MNIDFLLMDASNNSRDDQTQELMSNDYKKE